jgi:hypothetical protein
VTSYDTRKNAIIKLDIRAGSIEIFGKIPAFAKRIVEFYTNEIFFTACNRVKVQEWDITFMRCNPWRVREGCGMLEAH